MRFGTKIKICTLSAAGFAGLLLLAGCGSSSSMSGTTAAQSGTAPMVVTVSDAPLGNILSAKITISALSLGTSGGSGSVSVLSKPETVELSGLGAMQEPIELTNLAFGTYNSVSVTVSAAEVTYVNSTGQVTMANATLSSPSVTVALSPALTFNSQGEVQLQVGFNLAQSFSISGSTVTFAPAINTTGAQVNNESNGDRQVEVTGQVISSSATSIIVQSGDSGQQFTFTIDSSTQLPTGVTPGSIPAGTIVQVQGQTQADGSILALSITPLANGQMSGSQQDGGAKGIVVSVMHDNSGNLTSFTMVPQEDFGSMMPAATTLNVLVASSTTFGINEDAQQAGITGSMFSAMEVFPGQAVMVTGPMDSNGNLDAMQVMLGAENVQAVLAAPPQVSGSNADFMLTLPVPSFLNTYEKLVTLNVVAGSFTDYGNGMTATSFAAATAGTAVEVHGYLLVDQSGNYSMIASEIAQVETPEAPESGN